MHVINSPDAIQSVPWPEIRQLIQIRMLQNDINQDHGYLIHSFIVVGVNDSAHDVELEICAQLRQIPTADGMPLDEEFTPSHEWVITHPTCYEAAYIHCDRTRGICVLIPKVSGIDPDLLELGECYGMPVPDADVLPAVKTSPTIKGTIMQENNSAPAIILDAADCKFSPGQVVSTKAAISAMLEHQISPDSLLRRHLSGDWGSVPVEDAQLNDMSLESGDRLLSSYDISAGVRVWIITESDRSTTTFLLPSEY